MKQQLPVVTVIMPVYNEERFIERSLGAVLAQDYPTDLTEVFVVDGQSADGTRQLVIQLATKNPRVRLLDNPQRDQASAMNLGIAQAQGRIIIRIDGHGEIPPTYISTCVRTLQTSKADNVGGQMRAIGTTPLTKAIALATGSPLATGGSRFHYSDKPGDTDTVYLGAFRREIFESVGYFDPLAVPNEDYELNYRILASGGRVFYNPEIWASYHVRPSLIALIRQYFRYGWRKVFVIWQHPESTKMRHLAPPLFIFGVLVLALAGLLYPLANLGLAITICTYLLGIFVVSLGIASHNGWRNLPFLMIVFPAVHLSWGCGFLSGAIARLIGRKS